MVAETPEQLPRADARARLHALFADEAVLKIGHNLKYDIGVLAQHGLTIAPYDDTLVMSFALDAPVTDWLPDFQPKTADGTTPVITIRQLLTHTAGLTSVFLAPAAGAYHRPGHS